MDFTLRKYRSLLSALKEKGYEFLSFEEYFHRGGTRVCILRHDVDKMPGNALKMAAVEKHSGIRASYHFRYPNGKKYGNAIASLASEGHEIAYHYEELDVVSGQMTGFWERMRMRFKWGKLPDNEEYTSYLDRAISLFGSRLEEMRRFYPVRVISMHGSPLSPFDNRDVWRVRNYKDFGVDCEVYFDIDYSTILYLTDTGRRWDGDAFNLRDRPAENQQDTLGSGTADKFRFRSTGEIIDALRANLLPDSLIINTHPQRWNDNIFTWAGEKIGQELKNILKKALNNGYNDS